MNWDEDSSNLGKGWVRVVVVKMTPEQQMEKKYVEQELGNLFAMTLAWEDELNSIVQRE